MQDIGGCGAVVRNIKQLDLLVNLYEVSRSKNPRGRHEFVKADDYVKEPKVDGYRGVHLIYRYRSQSKEHGSWNQLKVEIQLRSRLQHSWATAVEIVDTFTGNHLKVGRGGAEWGLFFALMGTAMARREKKPLVPGTPESQEVLVAELRELNALLRVGHSFRMWQSAIRYLPIADKHSKDAYYFLLFLDTTDGEFTVEDYRKDQQIEAQEAYAEAERYVEAHPGTQTVLVSVDKISQLREAYPNYLGDTTAFMREVDRAIRRSPTKGGAQ